MPGLFDREANLRRLAGTEFDVLVVGGGITGAGVALDAASRGLRTALVERHDFASGTSSKSSKLVHGGLRYLQQGEVGLVYEALAERQRLMRNAPHLVKLLPFLLPVFTGKDGVIPKKLARAVGWAMWAYDLTGGARIGKLHQRISAEAARAHMPSLRPDRLGWAYVYYDAQADDARLTLAVVRTAVVGHGAAAANRCEVVDLRKGTGGRVRGALVRAALPGGGHRDIEVRAAAVVNATGVWSDDVRALDEGTHPRSIRPAKGIHITVPWRKVRNDIAVVVPVPKDRRSVFVVPWGDLTYVGTTDTDDDGPVDDPQCTPEDVDYLLRALNHSCDGDLTRDDVVGTWAGLRPLVRDAASERTADLSRRHSVRTSAGGVTTVTGGKLTTYRRMAADTVDAVLDQLDPTAGVSRRSRTRHLPLQGAAGYRSLVDDAPATSRVLDGATVLRLADRFGGEARALVAMCDADPDLAAPLVPGLPYLRAEALFSARYEMATTLDDILARRTRAHLLDAEATAAAAADVARLVGPDLGWDDAEQARQAAAHRELAAVERRSAGLPELVLLPRS